jgi:hypothetical protein
MKLNFILYLGMLATGSLAAFLGTDDAAKYIEPKTLFWITGILGVADQCLTGLKAFTSREFTEWLNRRAEKASAQNGQLAPPPNAS